jgi:uncharacterized protein
MPQGNVEVVRGAYEAFSRGDIPSIIAILREDIEWHIPQVLPHRFEAHNHDEVTQFFQQLAGMWDGLGVEVDEFVGSGDHVVVLGRTSGSFKGTETGYGFAHVWVMRDGKATRFLELVDPDRELLELSD